MNKLHVMGRLCSVCVKKIVLMLESIQSGSKFEARFVVFSNADSVTYSA